MIQLGDRVYLQPGGVNVGIVRGDDGRCILIDTGLNETSAKKALRAVKDDLHGQVVAIVTTHGHADHFGGNAAVVKRTDARVYAPAVDEAFLKYPLLQPVCLFAGADPPASMRGNFLLGKASPVDEIIPEQRLDVADIAFDVVSLAGHSPNQLGFVVDSVFFCADVVFPATVLAKYRIPYLFSVSDHLTALDRATEIGYTVAVPGHGEHTSALGDLVQLNREVVSGVGDQIVDFCDKPRTPGEIVEHLLTVAESPVADPAGFYLIQPTIYAFLTDLERRELLVHTVRAGRSEWQRA